jgi:hypothetical protein
MQQNSWWYVDPAWNNIPVAGEADNIVQGRVQGLTNIGLNCCTDVYALIQHRIDFGVSWTILQTPFQSSTSASRLMLKDKLVAIRPYKGVSVGECLRQILEVQNELTSIGHQTSELDIVVQMLNTVPPSINAVKTAFNGQAALSILADISARLLPVQIKIHHGITPNTKEEALPLSFQKLD